MALIGLERWQYRLFLIVITSLAIFLMLFLAYRQYLLHHKIVQPQFQPQPPPQTSIKTNRKVTAAKKHTSTLFGVPKQNQTTAVREGLPKLLGIIVLRTNKKVILGDETQQKIYSVGEKVSPGVIVYAIKNNQALLMSNGKLVRISFDPITLKAKNHEGIMTYEFGFSDE